MSGHHLFGGWQTGVSPVPGHSGGVATMTNHLIMQHEEEEDEDLQEEEESRKDFSGLIAKVKNYLLEYYEPVQNAKDADFHYSTEEIYRQLQKLTRNELLYSAFDVALWLHNAGFTFEDFGELRFEWLMKRKVL